MGKLRKAGVKSFACLVSGMILGILLGATVLCVLVSYRLDTFYEEIAYLKNIIDDKNAKLENLERSINNSNLVIKDIEVNLNFEGDEIDRIEIEKIIREKYIMLLGKEVKSVDADVIIEVIDKRILKMEKEEYKLKVNRLVLTEILKIWVEVEMIDS